MFISVILLSLLAANHISKAANECPTGAGYEAPPSEGYRQASFFFEEAKDQPHGQYIYEITSREDCASLCTSEASCLSFDFISEEYAFMENGSYCVLYSRRQSTGPGISTTTNSTFCRKQASCPEGYRDAQDGEFQSISSQAKLQTIGDIAVEDCAEACSSVTGCLSFEHSNAASICHLNSLSKPNAPKVKDFNFCSKELCPEGYEYEMAPLFSEQETPKESLQECGDFCFDNATCISFDYDTTDQTCYLKSSTTEATRSHHNATVSCKAICPMGYNLQQTHRDNFRVKRSYSNIQTLEECTDLCSPSMDCTSIQYSPTDQTCQELDIASGMDGSFKYCQRLPVKPAKYYKVKRLEWAMFLLPIFTGTLSFFSSAYLLYLVLIKENTHGKLWRPRQQLVLGLSVYDLFNSFALAFSTMPGPARSLEGRVADPFYWTFFPTFGNTTTCQIQGFLVQFGLVGAPLYNVSLCIYYVLVTVYHFRDADINRYRVIPIMHFVCNAFTTISCICLLVAGLFNFDGMMGCWVNTGRGVPCFDPDVWGCYFRPEYQTWECIHNYANIYETKDWEGEGCTRGDTTKYDVYLLVFVMAPIMLCFLLVILSMISMWCTIRKAELRNNRWVFQGSNGAGGQSTSLSQRAMVTGFLYGFSFLLVYIPSGVGNLIDSTGPLKDTFRVFTAFFTPLQGFFNVMIYTSPRWLPKAETAISRRSTLWFTNSTQNSAQNSSLVRTSTTSGLPVQSGMSFQSTVSDDTNPLGVESHPDSPDHMNTDSDPRRSADLIRTECDPIGADPISAESEQLGAESDCITSEHSKDINPGPS